MQKEVEEFLQGVQEEEKRRREELLMRAHIAKKEYSDEEGEEYPYYDNEKEKYYKEVPLEVSDEEWDALKEHLEGVDTEEKNADGSNISTLSRIFVVASLLCYVVAAIVCSAMKEPVFAFVILLCGVLNTVVFGGILSGIASVIKAQNQTVKAIYKKLKK